MLIKCKECDHEVSDSAKACPNCGVKIKSGSGFGYALLGILVLIAVIIIFGDGNSESTSTSGSSSGWQSAQFAISNIEGTWCHSDGIRSFTVREVASSGDRMNGRISWSPPVGDWATTLRCGVSGSDLIIELPASGSNGVTLVKLFEIQSASSIRGRFSPWEGSFAFHKP